MIIIKGQQGKIVPISDQDYLTCEAKTICAFPKYIAYEDYLLLGKYSTEQRALEVMVEIEERIRELKLIDVIKHTKDFDVDFDRMRNLAIYQMPKE